jgi:hypothetical protein
MDTRIDTTTTDDTLTEKGPARSRTRRSLPIIDLIIILALAIVALIPRIILARQLDMVTDEVVYITGGKIYLPLLRHLSIGASGWSYNYEHPPFVKLLIGLSLAFNTLLGHPLSELLAARVPSIIFGTLLIVALYWLGRGPFGRAVALLAALCLAFSPWLVYFSGLAYLDMTMTALITIAALLFWHAIRRPWLYPVAAILVGLAADSKYPAVLAIPGMLLFTAYYFFALRPYLPREQRPAFPWLWWLSAIVLAPLVFLAADPAIWPHPISLLIHSFRYEWNHSYNGHLTFIAGHYNWHVPHWAVLYMVIVKMSAFVTVPAAFFVIFALVQLVRFHLRASRIQPEEAASLAFLLIWLVAIVGMFSLLNIVVGTHYLLPIAPPLAFAGAFGLVALLRYPRGLLFRTAQPEAPVAEGENKPEAPAARPVRKPGLNPRAAITLVVLTVALAGPHLLGLTTIYAAEGYTSEFFHGENAVLQVAYPGYREGVQWLAAHTSQPASIGLVAIPGTLSHNSDGVSWYAFNSDLPTRFKLTEAHPTDYNLPYDYLIWPMHLVQRGYAIPEPWRSHVVHVVMGGNTIYCYILARYAGTTSP